MPNTATPYKTCRISVVPDDMLGNNVISVQPRSVDGSTSQHFTVVTSNSHPSFPSAAYSVKFDGVETPSSTACVLNEETLETDMHNSPSFAEELDTTSSSSTDAHEHHFCPRAESSSNTLTSSGSHASVHFDTTLFSQNGQVMPSFIEPSPSTSGSLTIKSVNDAIATTSTPQNSELASNVNSHFDETNVKILNKLPDHMNVLFIKTLEESHLDAYTADSLKRLLWEHQDTFAKNSTDLGFCQLLKYDIDKGDSTHQTVSPPSTFSGTRS